MSITTRPNPLFDNRAPCYLVTRGAIVEPILCRTFCGLRKRFLNYVSNEVVFVGFGQQDVDELAATRKKIFGRVID